MENGGGEKNCEALANFESDINSFHGKHLEYILYKSFFLRDPLHGIFLPKLLPQELFSAVIK